MNLLAIDTSCDDTAVAVLQADRVLSNVISSQIDIHKEWGGVVPNLARRAHEEKIDICISKSLKQAKIVYADLDAIAVTYGPGLAPALQVGVKKAKELSIEYNKPLIAVNHMEGHVLSSLLKNKEGHYYSRDAKNVSKIEFPVLALSVSGGHTEIVLVNAIGDYQIIGQTVDDAAGEAFDKVARMLDLGYPGGPAVEELAKKGNPEAYQIPRPMQNSNDFNFSFSGLKTHCLYSTNDLKKELGDQFHEIIPDYCASVQEAIVDSLLIKMKKAAKKYHPHMVWIGGGVSANVRFRKKFRDVFKRRGIPILFPDQKFCMDNAAMIGIAAYYKYQKKEFVKVVEELDRRPSITIESENEFEVKKDLV